VQHNRDPERIEVRRVRVLVVEDEPVLADTMAEWLRRESFAVDIAGDGEGALERLALHGYDVVVLDRDLPGISGDEVCRTIVSTGAGPRVLMVTAASAVRSRVEGLAIGADDYLVKPFAFLELSARVHALTRRSTSPLPPQLERSGIRWDPARREAYRDGVRLSLTVKEFALLGELLRADGTVVTTEQLLDKVWDENIDPFTNTVRVMVMKLRRKLGEPAVIETVPGAGYRLR
jgi:DNA-binding response OmpR family regulator